MKNGLSQIYMQALIAAFNRDFSPGSPVVLRTDSGPVDTIVESHAWILGGVPVAKFQGVSGAYEIEGRVRFRRVAATQETRRAS